MRGLGVVLWMSAVLAAKVALAQPDRLNQRVHDVVSAASGAQVDGVSIGDRNDRATWRIDFAATATAAQKQAARDALAAFDMTKPDPVKSAAGLNFLTVAEQAAVWKAAQADSSGAIGAGLLRILSVKTIDVSGAAFGNWLDRLVTAGAITAARKTEIVGG